MHISKHAFQVSGSRFHPRFHVVSSVASLCFPCFLCANVFVKKDTDKLFYEISNSHEPPCHGRMHISFPYSPLFRSRFPPYFYVLSSVASLCFPCFLCANGFVKKDDDKLFYEIS